MNLFPDDLFAIGIYLVLIGVFIRLAARRKWLGWVLILPGAFMILAVVVVGLYSLRIGI